MSLEEVLRNLNREIDGIKGNTKLGAFKAAKHIQARAVDLTPRDTSNLANSSFARPSRRGALVGFTAAYALFVHENMEQKLKGLPRSSGRGVYWGPDGQPKFLETPMKEDRKIILEIMRKEAAV